MIALAAFIALLQAEPAREALWPKGAPGAVGEEERDKPSITLQPDNASAPVLWTGSHGGEARLLVGSDPLELWHWSLGPGDERASDAHRPNAREALYVTGGAVTLCLGSGDPVVVKRGQSALFRADEPHSYRNDGKTAATFVLAGHEPSGGVP